MVFAKFRLCFWLWK